MTEVTTPPARAGVNSTARQRARRIQGALPIVARAIGRRLDVDVRIGGAQAKTNGRTIYLPDLPFEDEDVEILAFGFLEHEGAHVRYTSFIETQNPLHHALWNTIEDIRVERALGQEFPGFAQNLDRLVTKLVKEQRFLAPQPTDPMGEQLGAYLRYRLRADVLGQTAVEEYASVAESLVRAAFPSGACLRMGSAIGRVTALRSSQDAADLAAELLQLLQEEAQEPEPAPEPAADSPDPNAPPGGCASPGPDPQAQQRAELRRMLADTTQLGPDAGEAIRSALQDAAATAVKKASGGSFGKANTPLGTNPAHGETLLREVHDASIALRYKLRSRVESVRRSRRSYGRHGTTVSSQRLVHAMLGNPRLYRKKQLARAVNTAVLYLCDRSGSMRDQSHPTGASAMDIAIRSTLALTSGLAPIRGIVQEAAVFPGYQHDVEVLKDFRDSLASSLGRFGAVTAQGGTPLYPALLWAFERLLLRREPRKILLCVTDGEPAGGTHALCRQAIEAAVEGGIEVYGIGICVPTITTVFPQSQSINDLSELSSTAFAVIQSALTRPAVA